LLVLSTCRQSSSTVTASPDRCRSIVRDAEAGLTQRRRKTARVEYWEEVIQRDIVPTLWACASNVSRSFASTVSTLVIASRISVSSCVQCLRLSRGSQALEEEASRSVWITPMSRPVSTAWTARLPSAASVSNTVSRHMTVDTSLIAPNHSMSSPELTRSVERHLSF